MSTTSSSRGITQTVSEVLPVWGSDSKVLSKVLDVDGHEITKGDVVESPARTDDPIVGKVLITWHEWPYGTPFVLIGSGPMPCAVKADECLILRKEV